MMSRLKNFDIKGASIALAIYCIAFMLYREWQVYQHFLVISRDFYPVMSEFYKMYASYFVSCASNLTACFLGYRSSQFIAKVIA